MIKTMKFMTTFLLALFPLVMPVFVMSADVYTHTQTGILFPPEIAAHKMNGTYVYEQKALGESVTYDHEAATATVYIYDYNRMDIKDDSDHSMILEELSNSLEQIRTLQRKGFYENVEIGNEGQMSEKADGLVFISVPVLYHVVKNVETGEKMAPQPTHSMISVGIYRHHFIKIRYSVQRSGQEDVTKASIHRDAFMSNISKLIHEVDLKSDVEKLMRTYRKDPFSEEGKEALGAIVAYAEMSALINITLDSDKMSWLIREDYPYGAALLGSYIVGQVNYQLSNNHFETNDKAGMDQLLQDYARLRTRDKKAIIQSLEEQLKKP